MKATITLPDTTTTEFLTFDQIKYVEGIYVPVRKLTGGLERIVVIGYRYTDRTPQNKVILYLGSSIDGGDNVEPADQTYWADYKFVKTAEKLSILVK